jgi:LPXTG-motif cell wall-anchored protein
VHHRETKGAIVLRGLAVICAALGGAAALAGPAAAAPPSHFVTITLTAVSPTPPAPSSHVLGAQKTASRPAVTLPFTGQQTGFAALAGVLLLSSGFLLRYTSSRRS